MNLINVAKVMSVMIIMKDMIMMTIRINMKTDLVRQLQLLSGEVQLSPPLTGQVHVHNLVAIPADLKLLVGPDVELLPLVVDLPNYAPDRQVVQVHLAIGGVQERSTREGKTRTGQQLSTTDG